MGLWIQQRTAILVASKQLLNQVELIDRRYSEIKELTVCGPKGKYLFIYNIPHA